MSAPAPYAYGGLPAVAAPPPVYLRDPSQNFPPAVLAAETPRISARREAAGFAAAESAEAKVKESLVGLALSGGGIRSAAFNLGLLQSFFRNGLLRHVDYLSTVSGGGYIGTWFSTLVHRQPAAGAASAQPAAATKQLQNELCSQKGRQSHRVINLARNGKYLDRLSKVWSFWSIGFLANNLAIFSLLAFICLAIAYCWRAMDTNAAVFYIYYQWSGYWLNESVRPMLPAALLALWWIAAWAFDYRARLIKENHRPMALVAGLGGIAAGLAGIIGSTLLAVAVCFGSPLAALFIVPFWIAMLAYALYEFGFWSDGRPTEAGSPWGRIANALFLLVTVHALIGVAVFLANPVTNFTFGEAVSSATEVSDKTQTFVWPLLGLLLTALTPFLRPQRLIQSGLNPKNVWEQRIFTIATSALLFGLPLAMVWYFSHHDFARKNKDRAFALTPGDLNNPDKWIKRLKLAETTGDAPVQFVWRQIRPVVDQINAQATLNGHYKSNDEGESGVFREMAKVSVHVDQAIRNAKEDLIQALNAKVVDSPEFTKIVWETAVGPWPWRTEFADSRYFRFYLAGHHAAPEIVKHMNQAQHEKFANGDEKQSKRIRMLNRQLVEAIFPDNFMPSNKVTRPNTVDVDQERRETWLLIALGALLLCGLFVNVNATSMHNFYRERLAETFVCGDGAGRHAPITLAELDTTSRGWPYHLYSATLNRKPSEPAPSHLDPGHLGQTKTEGFLLSPLYCGSNSKGFQATMQYGGRQLTVADAMAISGAAVSPIQVTSPFIVVLMVAANARTGQWLACPGLNGESAAESSGITRLRDWACARLEGAVGPTLLGLLLDRLLAKRDERRLYFVTDGGHHENLGIWPLLERRCRLIIASDASEDAGSGFGDLLRVVRRARYEHGIRITGLGRREFDSADDEDVTQDAEFVNLLRLLRSAEEPAEPKDPKAPFAGAAPRYRRSNRHFFLARIKYPDAADGLFLYIKPTLSGDEAADLQAYAAQNYDFPHHPTPDQLYDEDRFESYRQLGEHIGDQFRAECQGQTKEDLATCSSLLVTLEDDSLMLQKRQAAALKQKAAEDRHSALLEPIKSATERAHALRRKGG